MPGCPNIKRFDGREIRNQDGHYAILDMDIGSTDLQQCADAVIRLRAEYLFSTACSEEISFNFTSGDRAFWEDWHKGTRPLVNGNEVKWRVIAEPDASYSNFHNYLDTVFMYAGSMSLSRELLPVSDPSKLEIGDVYIIGGFPGHAMIVIDVAENDKGDRIFLLAQGMMPAQDIHILRSGESIDPWFTARKEGDFEIPGLKRIGITINDSQELNVFEIWPFNYTDLKRFKRTDCEPPR